MQNKKLEELFNLPTGEPNEPEAKEEHPESHVVTDEERGIVTLEAAHALDKINEALPQVRGLDAADKEMDDLADLATATYKDLVDLGMNVEARFSSEIFHSASSFLGHAITAKTAKINKKLKMLDLQLKKAKMDADLNPEEVGAASGSVMDRNELLEKILKDSAKKGESK